jgi:ABC-type amino acid transport substrate-binding protein
MKNTPKQLIRARGWKRIWQCLAAGVLACTTLASADDVLRVGITPNQPPMAFKQDGKIVGVEADFARALGAQLGREVKFVEVDWEDQIPELLANHTDIIMSSMSVTTLRQLRVDFCTPYLQIGQMTLVRAEDANKYLLGFPAPPPGVIGVIKATTGDFVVQENFPRLKRKEYTTGEEAARALVKKKIDLFISDSPTIWWLASVNEVNGLTIVPQLLTNEQLAWAVNKSNPGLRDAANAALYKWQKDGTAQRILKQWVPAYK